jgi:hypothetical protein
VRLALAVTISVMLGQAADVDHLIPQLSPAYAVDIHLRLALADPERHVPAARGIFPVIRDQAMASALGPRLVERLLHVDPEGAMPLALSVSDRRYRAAACGFVAEYWQSRDRGRTLQLLADCARTGALASDALRRVLPRWLREDPDAVRSLMPSLLAAVSTETDESEIDFLIETASRLDAQDPALPALVVQSLTASLGKSPETGDAVLLARDDRGSWLTSSTAESLRLRIAWQMKRDQPDLFQRLRGLFGRWSDPPAQVEFVRQLRNETSEDRELWDELDQLDYDDAREAIDDVENPESRMAMLMHLLQRVSFDAEQRAAITRSIIETTYQARSKQRVLEALRRLAELRLNDGDPSVLRAWGEWLQRICQPEGIPACFDAYGDYLRVAPGGSSTSDLYLRARQSLGN